MAQNKFPLSNSIYRQLLLAFVLAALTPALIIGSVSAWSSYQIGRQRTLNHLDSMVTLKSAEIDLWTNELNVGSNMLLSERDMAETVLPLLQGELSPADASQARDSLIKSANLILAKNPLFNRVCLMDVKGRVIASTDPTYESRDLSGENFYQQGLQKPFITPPFHNSQQDQFLTIVVSRPIIAPGQGAVGVLAGYSDISVLDRIMEEPMGLDQAESYLVGAEYAPLTKLRFQTDTPITEVRTEGTRLAIENKIRGQGFYSNYQKKAVIGAYTWLPTLQAALVVEQNQKAAYGSIITTLEINLGVVLAAMALTVLAAFLVTRSIATPLRILSATATQIAAGDLDHVADVKRQDEIGKLAQAFNRMTAQLRNLIKELQTELAERRKAEEALRTSNERFRQVAENASEWIWEVDQNGLYTYASPGVERILGYTPQEVVNHLYFYDLLEPEHQEAVKQEVFAAFAQKVIFKDYVNVNRRKDGQTVILSTSGVPLLDENGNLIGYRGVDMNITERKQAEEQLKNYSEHLEEMVESRTRELRNTQEHLVRQEKLAMLGQLAGGVGHELRNPLAVINNAVYYLKLVQPDANEKIKEYLNMIEIETHSAEKIITELLDFARIKSMDREPVSVSELVQRVLERCPMPASVTVLLDFPSDLPPIYADPRQMEQVLGNLVLNACQAMPEGGQLSVSGNRLSVNTDHWLLITVQDTGEGISPENMSKLFEPLFTTKTKGIGLGLAVSQKLAEANEGRIEVQSEPGAGSTFTLWLPVIQL